jgi:RND family efflux transporter MFP subunit
MLRFRAFLFGVCLLPFVLAACDAQPTGRDPRTQPPSVRVASVTGGQATQRAFSGVVVARTQSDLSFRVSGKVLERFVDTGQAVQRGQPLMRLDAADLGLQAKARQHAVVAAQARAVQTADDEYRHRDLVSAGAISAVDYQRLKALAETAQAQLQAALAQAQVATHEARYTLLAADSEGVVVQTLAEPGQVVSPGQTVVKLAKAGPREAVVQLPETFRPALGSQAQARLFGATGSAVAATLRQLSSAADPLTRTFEARYVLQGEQALAPLGATVTLDIAADSAAEAGFRIPLAALYDPGNGPGVWIVTGTPAKVSWRAIQVLGLSDDTARVLGVRKGEQLIALGPHLLHEGNEVRILHNDPHAMAWGQP